MSLNRAAYKVAPMLLRRSLRGSRPIQSRLPAVAILIPRLPLSTETSSSRGSGNGAPPPGFNIELAKRPIQKEARDAAKPAQDSKSAAAEATGQESIPKTTSNAVPETGGAGALSSTELAAEKATLKSDDKSMAKKKDEEKKPTIWQRVKKEVIHYWDGTKLLAAEVNISSRLALKMAAGYELTRREHRQVRPPSHCDKRLLT
jgi:LETM1 and EF-hand domain-containing protein 1, mitochondrial